MNCPYHHDEGQSEVTSIDLMIRDPQIERQAIAKKLGVSPTGLYAHLRDELGVCVATTAFLVDARTGKPFFGIDEEQILTAGQKAISKHKNKLQS